MTTFWRGPISFGLTSRFNISRVTIRFLSGLLLCMMALWPVGTNAACSSYAGVTSGPISSKISINEYNYSGNFIELKIIDPAIVATTSNFNGWTLSLFKKPGGGGSTRADYLVKDAFLDAANGCGIASQYIKIPVGSPGNDSVVVLWSDSAMTQEVDYFRIGQGGYPTGQPSTCFASSEFTVVSSVTWHQAALTGSSARKDIARGPDGTGKWIEAPYNGADQGTSCTTNDATLVISKNVASATTVYVGEQVSFQVQVSLNSRAGKQSSVLVNDLLPSGLSYVSHSVSIGSYASGTGVWTIGSLSSGGSATLNITARATSVGTLTNSATVQSSDFPAGTVASASASVNVLQPLTLSKTVSPASVPYNTAASFTVTVTNNSPAALPSSFIVNDALPAGLTPGTPVASPGSSYGAGVWTINSGMAAGSSQTLTLPVTSQTTAGSFTNTAQATAPFGGANLSASATLTVSAVVAVSGFNAFETATAAGAVTGKIYTKLAGMGPFGLDVVAISAGAQAAGFSNNVKVELLANSGTAGSGYGADNCPTSNAVLQTIASTPIASGRSTVSFAAVGIASRDVRVRISYPTSSPTVTICSTDSFALRPQSLTVTSSNANADAAGLSTVAAPVIKAGAALTLTATAVAGYSTTPVLDPSTASAHAGAVATGVPAGLFGAAIPASGVASGAGFTYTEVGFFRLTANGVYDDQFTAAVDAPADCTNDFSNTLVGGKYGCKFGNTTVTSYFGRFVPDHFALTPGSLIDRAGINTGASESCPSVFSYMGEDFKSSFTLTAQNLANATTQNYTGGHAKFDLTSWNNFAFTASSATLQQGTAAPSGSWSSTAGTYGTAAVTATHKLQRPAAPTAPHTAFSVSAQPTYTESSATVALAASAVTHAGTSEQRFGRLRPLNAYGSELLALAVSLEAQYWTGSSFAVNALDSCTSLAAANVNLLNYKGGLSPTNMGISHVTAVGTLVAGRGSVSLSRPSPASTAMGSMDVILNLGSTGTTVTCPTATPSTPLGSSTSAAQPYLSGNWCGAAGYDRDPTARATFGIYKSPLIYRRENY